jgi:hypothetical protein
MTIMLEQSDGTEARATIAPVTRPSPDDLLLLISDGATGDFDLDRIRLMKAAFLVMQKGPNEWQDCFTFRPYDYGPFDRRVYVGRDRLIAAGLLASDPHARYDDYSVTDAGKARLAEIDDELGKDRADWVRNIGRWVTSRSFSSLIKSIYAAYPDYAEHSALVRG